MLKLNGLRPLRRIATMVFGWLTKDRASVGEEAQMWTVSQQDWLALRSHNKLSLLTQPAPSYDRAWRAATSTVSSTPTVA